jgi:hypothetical protein
MGASSPNVMRSNHQPTHINKQKYTHPFLLNALTDNLNVSLAIQLASEYEREIKTYLDFR